MGRIKGKTLDWVDLGFKRSTFNLMKADSEIRELVLSDEKEFKRLCERYFSSKNVYENRVLAQRIGVESATTLNKLELVEKLLDKVWGVQYFSTGFPRNKRAEIGLLDAETELQILEDIKKGDVIIGTECEGVFEAKEEGGILWDIQGNFANAYLDIYVPRNLVGVFRLQDGDRIKARMRYVEQLGYNVIFHIDELNGIFVDMDNQRPEVNVNPITPCEKLDLSGSSVAVKGLQLFAPVCYGQFGVVSIKGRTSFTEQAITVFNALDKEKVCAQLFVLGEKEHTLNEAKAKLSEYNNVYYSGMCDDQTFYLDKVLKYVSMQAKYNGSKHVVVVSDLDRLDSVETETSVTPIRLASYAGAYDNGGSVTIIAIASSFSPVGAYQTIRNYADFELAFKSTASVNQNVIDMMASYSFSNREVSREETVAVAKLQQFSVTEGATSVERRIAAFESVADLIQELND